MYILNIIRPVKYTFIMQVYNNDIAIASINIFNLCHNTDKIVILIPIAN